MIKHLIDECFFSGRKSLFDEYDGLNPVGFGWSPVPFTSVMSFSQNDEPATCVITYTRRINESTGVREYASFDNTVSDSVRIGSLSGDIMLDFEFNSPVVMDAVSLDFAGSSIPAFDMTLRGLAPDGVSFVTLGVVRAGFYNRCNVPSVNVFSSYGTGRSQFGSAGTVACRFFNDSFQSRRYSVAMSPVSRSDAYLTARRIQAYPHGAFSSPVVSYPLMYNSSPSSFGERPVVYGVSFSDGALFANANSYISFSDFFLFGLEEYSISFSMRVSSLPAGDGAVFSIGNGYVFMLHPDGGDAVLSWLGMSCQLGALGEWHRITVDCQGGVHGLHVDGERKSSVRKDASPFFGTTASGFILGNCTMSQGVAGMEIKKLCFYDHSIGKDVILLEERRLK